jgi:4-hydroxy-tetrahydrodipicolinate synthase
VIYSAVPTLFGRDGSIDLPANRELYTHVSSLVDGLFVAGTTGEFPALADDERLALIRLAVEIAGPDRVIAHIGAPSAWQAARLAVAAAGLGATQLAAITPFYLPPRPDELIGHYSTIRAAVPGHALYAYIFPERTGVPVPPPFFAWVADAAGLAGAKLSGSASDLVASYAAQTPGLSFFCGDDANPARSAWLGAAGVISGRSAAYPEVYAGLSGPDAVAWQERLDRIVPLGSSIGRIKHAIALRGFGGETARMAADPPDAEVAALIADEVAALTPA